METSMSQDNLQKVGTPLLVEESAFSASTLSHSSLPVEQLLKHRKSYQYRALLRKQCSLQWRQKWTNCCQIVIPLILVSLVGLTQVLIQEFLVSKIQTGNKVIPDPSQVTLQPENPQVTDWQSLPSDIDWQYYGLWNGGYWGGTDQIGNLTEDGEVRSGLLGAIRQYQNETDLTSFVPYFVPFDTLDQMNSEVESRKNYWVQQQAASAQFPPRCHTCPQSIVGFDSLDVEEKSMQYTVEVDTQLGLQPKLTYHVVMNDLHQALLRRTLNQSGNETSSYTILTWAQIMPFVTVVPPFDISAVLAVILYPFAVSFLFPVYVNAIVLEKEAKLREMMKMMGLKMSAYWISTWLYCVSLYLLVMLLVFAVSFAFLLQIFTQTSVTLQLVLYLGWGLAQIPTAYIFTVIFNKARSATIAAYLVVIASVVVFYVLNYEVYSNSDLGASAIFFIYPPFAFYRGLFLMYFSCTFERCPDWGDWAGSPQLIAITVILYVEAVLYMPLAIYLDEVVPREFGVPRHPLFPLHAVVNFFKQRFNKTEEYAKSEAISLMVAGSADELRIEEEKDVVRERERVYRREFSSECPIVIQDLHKKYDSAKTAVHSLCLAVEEGECLGLLGHNGAGKTTTISMLTGLFPPTSGTAFICGYDIREDIDRIHRVCSVCPQFDILWEDLTCEETLLFYSRLKGVPPKEEQEHVKQALYDIGLDQYSKRMAKQLSGGMKRRLSMGVALVGDPKVIFLDEPTTGLDPETRRHLWDILLKVKKGRCMVLTTHSMEEADILSSRIAIMSHGLLKAIGSQLHLKNKYGEGYSVHVNYREMDKDGVAKFIFELLPTAQLVESFEGTSTFQVKRNQLVISEVFDRIESMKSSVGITDWGVSQTSLEDVFLKIAKAEEVEYGA